MVLYWCLVAYNVVSDYANTCNVMYTVILNIIKTKNMSDPLHTINEKLVTIITILITVFWLLCNIADLYVLITWASRGNSWVNTVVLALSLGTGNYILQYILPVLSVNYLYIVAISVLLIHDIIPVVIVFICMFIQTYHIKRTLRTHTNSPQLSSPTHINNTIYMISILFFVCNVTLTIIWTLVVCAHVHIPWILLGFAFSTLPLVNAALFPPILIIRKPELRAVFKHMILEVLRALCGACRKMRCVIYRRNREIQGQETWE